MGLIGQTFGPFRRKWEPGMESSRDGKASKCRMRLEYRRGRVTCQHNIDRERVYFSLNGVIRQWGCRWLLMTAVAVEEVAFAESQNAQSSDEATDAPRRHHLAALRNEQPVTLERRVRDRL